MGQALNAWAWVPLVQHAAPLLAWCFAGILGGSLGVGRGSREWLA